MQDIKLKHIKTFQKGGVLAYKMRNKKGFLAISQISILVVAIFAFAFIIGGAGFVRGENANVDPGNACGDCTLSDLENNKGECANRGGECVKPPIGQEYWEEGQKAITNNGYYGQIECCLCGPNNPTSCLIPIECTTEGKCEGKSDGNSYECTGELWKYVDSCEDTETQSSSQETQGASNGEDGGTTNTEADKNEISSIPMKVINALSLTREGIEGYEYLKGKIPESELRGQDYIDKLKGKKTGKGWFKKWSPETFGGKTLKGLTGGLTAAAAAYSFGKAIKNLFFSKSSEMNERGLDTAIWLATGTAGVGVGIMSALGTLGPGFWGSMAGAGVIGAGVAAAAILTFVLTSYKIYTQEYFEATVKIWKPETGGERCEMCNELETCFEYQCQSLGQDCKLVEQGTQGQGVCIEANPGDRTSPTIIELLNSALPTTEYDYEEFTGTSPADQGAKIIYDLPSKCVKPYSDVSFGFRTDELAECRVSMDRTANFSEMTGCMDEGCYFLENHTITIPHTLTATGYAFEELGLSLDNGNEYNLYVRCRDTQGNIMKTNFGFNFCIEEKDTWAPEIRGTSPADGDLMAFNSSSEMMRVFLNEPAECKWDFDDQSYEEMEFQFENCTEEILPLYGIDSSYGCSGTIPGISSRDETTVYIRCKDKPGLTENRSKETGEKRIANPVSEKVSVKATEPLILESITINDAENGTIIKGANAPIPVEFKVETSAGAENGKSICTYSQTYSSDILDYENFDNEGDYDYVKENTNKMYLEEGLYNYFIRCIDIAGNTAETMVEFDVDEDNQEPRVVRVYKDSLNLKVVTDEPAECVYSTAQNNKCNYAFDLGNSMDSVGNTHFVSWEENKVYYIKCKDEYNNLPFTGECSLTARAIGN